jgi:hypothetical protein
MKQKAFKVTPGTSRVSQKPSKVTPKTSKVSPKPPKVSSKMWRRSQISHKACSHQPQSLQSPSGASWSRPSACRYRPGASQMPPISSKRKLPAIKKLAVWKYNIKLRSLDASKTFPDRSLYLRPPPTLAEVICLLICVIDPRTPFMHNGSKHASTVAANLQAQQQKNT